MFLPFRSELDGLWSWLMGNQLWGGQKGILEVGIECEILFQRFPAHIQIPLRIQSPFVIKLSNIIEIMLTNIRQATMGKILKLKALMSNSNFWWNFSFEQAKAEILVPNLTTFVFFFHSWLIFDLICDLFCDLIIFIFEP